MPNTMGKDLKRVLKESKEKEKAKPLTITYISGQRKKMPPLSVSNAARYKAVQIADAVRLRPGNYVGKEGFARIANEFGLSATEREASLKLLPELRKIMLWRGPSRHLIARGADVVYEKVTQTALANLPSRTMSEKELSEHIDKLVAEKAKDFGVSEPLLRATATGARKRFIDNFWHFLKERKVLA
jgi:hypothetical protein